MDLKSKRALLIILDSVGCGAAPDAANYGDEGANTLGHILARHPDLSIPHLRPENWSAVLSPQSAGKDTTTGHWELMGVVLDEPFSTFRKFPVELVEEIERLTQVRFIGNYAASGMDVLNQLGKQHIETGFPILYTSADSVFQIAAHEEIFGLERLYEICKTARIVADKWKIGRVIARPFIGENGNWTRTSNRKDYSYMPPETALNRLQNAGISTVGIGKISDIFADSGIDESHPTKSNTDGMQTIEKLWQQELDQPRFYFANLVDFDTLYGHRRDVEGYGRALEQFDAWFGEFLKLVSKLDLVLVTADHGNDPTFRGNDHTRENVPLIVSGNGEIKRFENQSFGLVARLIERYFSD
jgi:phosphopentomutase